MMLAIVRCLSSSGRQRPGFTLLELLIVVAILGILMGIVAVKLRPMFHMGLTYDVRRKSDVRQLRYALTQALIQNVLPPANISYGEKNAKWICQYSYKGLNCVNPPVEGIDLSFLVPDYLSDIPVDPAVTDPALSGYKIYKDGAFFIIVAPNTGTLPNASK